MSTPSAPERIIFVPFFDAFGGVERLVLHLSRYLHSQGSTHVVACFSQSIDLASYASWPLTVRQLAPRRNPLSEAHALGKYLRRARACGSPRALVFDLNGAFYAGMFSPAGYALHLTDPPSLLPRDISKNAPSQRRSKFNDRQPHSRRPLLQRLRAEAMHRINKRGVRRAGEVIVMTHRIASEVRERYSTEPRIVRPGVPEAQGLEALGRAAPVEGEPVRLLSVSRLEPSKRIDWILQALAALPVGEARRWRLDVIGQGPQASELKALAQSLGIASHVCFHGQVSDEQLRQAYSQAHLFLMPAAQGYGLPALEALAAGIPVILHHESGVAEILGSTPWAEIVGNEPGSLAVALSSMMGRLQAGEFSRQQAPQVPTEQAWAEQICHACGWL